MSPRARQLVAWTTAVVVLAGVFAMYTRPAMLVTLAEQLWSCVN